MFQLRASDRAIAKMVHKLMASDLVKEIIKNHEIKVNHEEPNPVFAWSFLEELAKLGLTGMNIPEPYGPGSDNLSETVAMKAMSAHSAGLALATIGVGDSLTAFPIYTFGSDFQKQKYLPDIASGKILGCFALTTPNQGSDAGSIDTRALRVEGGWNLTGEKQFITNGDIAGFWIIFARTNPNEKGAKGISAFILDKPGSQPSNFSFKIEHKIGQHPAHFGRGLFNDFFAPESALMGQENEGFKIAMQTLEHGRVRIAAQGAGLIEAALREIKLWAEDRKVRGRALTEYPAIKSRIMEMAVMHFVAETLAFEAAWLEDQKKDFGLTASMAKLYASEAAVKAALMCQLTHGGGGYMIETPASRLVTDAVALPIYEGASDVQCAIIWRALQKDTYSISPYEELPSYGLRLLGQMLRQKCFEALEDPADPLDAESNQSHIFKLARALAFYEGLILTLQRADWPEHILGPLNQMAEEAARKIIYLF